jgi:hypothetical protein
MTYQVELKEIVKGVKETCPNCRTKYGVKGEKVSIVSYGLCSRCLLEKELGHSYVSKTWDCECGKKFMTKKNLDRHCHNFYHQQNYKQEVIK